MNDHLSSPDSTGSVFLYYDTMEALKVGNLLAILFLSRDLVSLRNFGKNFKIDSSVNLYKGVRYVCRTACRGV